MRVASRYFKGPELLVDYQVRLGRARPLVPTPEPGCGDAGCGVPLPCSSPAPGRVPGGLQPAAARERERGQPGYKSCRLERLLSDRCNLPGVNLRQGVK